MDINLYKGESLQTADFIPLDLNEDNVIKLAKNVNNYRAHQAEIAFLAGQLEPIHQNSPYVSLNGEIIKKYDENLWTENPEVQSLLINMAIDAGIGVLSGSSGKNEVHFLSDVIPTRSPVDPAFRGWCSFKGHLSRYQGWNAFNKGDFIKALDYCKKAGKLRDGFAFEICSRIYYEGLGTSQSKGHAIYWMALGADYGIYDMQKILLAG